MPYINYGLREPLDTGAVPGNAGELNYLITRTILMYLERNGLSYQKINDVVGVLEAAKLELYNRVVTPYEELKVEENGDIPLYALIDDAIGEKWRKLYEEQGEEDIS